MRILLQHVRTKQYFRSTGVWTNFSHLGFDFSHSRRAIEFAAKHCISDVHLVVQFPGEPDEVVPLPAWDGALEEPIAA